MASDLQHCAACDEEYVAGVSACVECGGPLQPGPLERLEKRTQALTGSAPQGRDASAAAPPDRLLAELPGLQADHAVRALLREDIVCAVECRGVRKVYTPDQPPAEPFAVTLPVTVFVPAVHFEAAQVIVALFEADDVIGDQWADAGGEASEMSDRTAVEAAPIVEPAAEHEPALDEEPSADEQPAAESTSLRTVALIVIAALVLLFLFGR